MARRRRRAGTGPLNSRQQCALRYLAEHTDAAPSPSKATNWNTPKRVAMAFSVADAIAAEASPEGAVYPRRKAYSVNGAANTLSSLRRRGYVANDGGGCFVQNRWWITPEGVEALAKLPA